MTSSKRASTRKSRGKAGSGGPISALIPPLAPVRQKVSEERVEDVDAAVRAGLRNLPLQERVRAGMRVAVGVSSRGISAYREVVAAVVAELRALGAQPYLVPAMGSHGGGTPEGQRRVIEDYGLSEERLGAPILSSMEVVELGRTAVGMPVYFDRHAAEMDAILVVNRIKPHTSFRGKYESGLLKMLSVGFGKQRGAEVIHTWGLAEAIPAAARVILEKLPVIGGVGIVENGKHEPAKIAVLPAEQLEAEEPALLDLARRLSPRIPFEPIDLLVVQRIGKDISGTGMDLNVVGMWRRNGGPVEPRISVLAALDLSENSHGNAIGVGHADLISRRLRDKIDFKATYTNCLAAHNLSGAKIPLTLANDREVIEAGLFGAPPDQVRMVMIRDTLTLDVLWASPALMEEAAVNPLLEILGPPRPLAFDMEGNLIWPGLDDQSG